MCQWIDFHLWQWYKPSSAQMMPSVTTKKKDIPNLQVYWINKVATTWETIMSGNIN